MKDVENEMSLRDYFAAKVVPAIYERVDSGSFKRIAKLSYELADEMLEARKDESLSEAANGLMSLSIRGE